MTDHTDNKEIASQMILAHRGLGSWSAVAKLCGLNSKGEPWSPTMAWWWGNGRRPIPETVAIAWQINVTPAMLRSWAPRQRVPRVSIEVSPEMRDSLRLRLKQPGDTWDDAFGRVLNDTHTGSAPHLFSFLSPETLDEIMGDLSLQCLIVRSIDPFEFALSYEDKVTAHWWLDRLELELSMRKTPDWARKE